MISLYLPIKATKSEKKPHDRARFRPVMSETTPLLLFPGDKLLVNNSEPSGARVTFRPGGASCGGCLCY
jgi:hypothetical protein